MSRPVIIELHGLLGDALEASRRGRLSHFIVDEHSPAIAIFGAAHKQQNIEGDWYGEHAGKWLIAASKAAVRAHDARLLANVRRVADFLVAQQEEDGYLGTYAPSRRFMQKQPPKPFTWNGEPALRTWDIWTHAYLILGLIEAHRATQMPQYLHAARRIADLCWRTLSRGDIDITELGNHHGMSATVLMDPAVELHFATGEPRYLDLALLILRQADAHPPLALLSRARAGVDASEIATGKAYQLLWNMVGIAKLHRATGDTTYREAAEHVWQNVRAHHLTLGGGPWGGVAHRSREVFNPAGYFSPGGYVETCSVLAWLQLNRELLAISGDARYADEIERTAYNDLLGAMAVNGEDWCYYTFPNGKRVHTTYWRCCKSSGAMALEELPDLAYGVPREGGVAIHQYGPGEATFALPQGARMMLTQRTRYPFDGDIRIRVGVERSVRARIALRDPGWSGGAAVEVDGKPALHASPSGRYVVIEREWRDGDELVMRMTMDPVVHRRTSRNVQESRAPDGTAIRQEVVRYEYLAVTRGPLAYATPLIDGFKTAETIRVPTDPHAAWLVVLPWSADDAGPTIRLCAASRDAIDFVPYYRAGGREDGAWRLTWLAVAPETTPSGA